VQFRTNVYSTYTQQMIEMHDYEDIHDYDATSSLNYITPTDLKRKTGSSIAIVSAEIFWSPRNLIDAILVYLELVPRQTLMRF